MLTPTKGPLSYSAFAIEYNSLKNIFEKLFSKI